EDARFMASRATAANGSEPGLCKTATAILAYGLIGATSGLVTCPASVRSHWRDQIEEVHGHTRGWDIISYDGARIDSHRAVLKSKYDVFIPDEVHFCKTCDSQRTHAIFGKNGLAKRAQQAIWPLSGTMSPNGRPVELWPMLRSLHPGFKDMKFATYALKYCGMYFDGREMNVKGASNVDELALLLRDFMIRRTEREVFPDRLAPLVSAVPLELSPAALQYVNSIEDEIGGREARISSSYEKYSQLGDSARLLRALGMAMAPQTAEFVLDKLETVDKALVFFKHTDVGHQLYREFSAAGLQPTVLQGGMNDVQKDAAKQKFRDDPACRVFLGQVQAAGTGVDGLQEVCSTAVFAEPDWTPGETEQRVRRLARTGQKQALVKAYVLYARATLSAVVVKVHDFKETRRERLENPWKNALGSFA
ncbi:MAG: DEAD/DEAH box helicase, partial [bacterium]